MLGPIPGLDPPLERLGMFLEGGADGVLLSTGMLRASAGLMAGRKTGIIVRLDWTNMWRNTNLLGFGEGRPLLPWKMRSAGAPMRG